MQLTADRLREVLSYDSETGIFRWKLPTARAVKTGDVAGVAKYDGYILIGIDRRLYRAHRLAWLYVTGEWPKDNIDHVNGIASDNRFSNLRSATSSQNNCNSKTRSDNGTGLKGVTWIKDRIWRAQIKAGGSLRHLGYFKSPEEAHDAYCAAAEKYHGQFARFE